MLKLIYTELGLHMDYESASLETVVAQHVILNIRTGHNLHIELGQASFLLPVETPEINGLDSALRRYPMTLAITPVDVDYVELELGGTWMAQTSNAHEGIFLAAYDYETELSLHRLWHATGQPLVPAT